jgi:hypothetical protein
MVPTTALAIVAAGGPVRRALQRPPGAATCFATMAVHTGGTPSRRSPSRSVA